MSDTGFREIQLSGKHVVFLFMAGAVAAIAIFLLGVSVGRGAVKPDPATEPPAATPAAPSADAGAPSSTPPATTPARGELQYFTALQGKATPGATPSPSPSVSPDASPSPQASPAQPAVTPAPVPSTSPAAKPAAPPTTAGQWYVQIDSFASRDNALKRISELKGKGFTAVLHTAAGSGAIYKVRMGPYDEQGTADMMARLRKEGYKPSRTR